MTTTDHLSGAQSAARIIGRSKWESPCGFGTCAGHIDCSEKQCPEHPCKTGMLGLPVLDTMTDDRFNLHRFDASQLGPRDGVSVGSCRTDLPIQFAEEETTGLLNNIKRDAMFWLTYGAGAVVGGLTLAAVIYASSRGTL